MDSGKYDRSITLMCPTCGGQSFEFENPEAEDAPIRCVSCDRVFSRAELIDENAETIDAQVDEVSKKVVVDAQKQFTDSLRKAFRGSKTVKFR